MKHQEHSGSQTNWPIAGGFSLLFLILKTSLLRLKKAIFKGIIGRNYVEALLVNTRQGIFLVDIEDMGVGRSIAGKGAYGQDEIRRILSLTNSESSVLFVGSHIGTLVIPVSMKVKRVTAIEANPDTFKLLTKNILLNGCENVRAIHIAASDQKGELEFVLSKTNSGGSKRMPTIKSHLYFYDKPNVVKVNADRLDDVLPDKYDLIVMDIEGSEYFALKGMARILSQADHLIVEFIPHHLRNVSNVSVKEFLATIDPYFNILNIPSRQLTIEKPQVLSVLEHMYDFNQVDDGVIFSKRY